MAAREAHVEIRDCVPTERLVEAAGRRSAAPAFLAFPSFALTLAFLALACSTSFGYANDVEIPKQEFKTREEFAKYREAAWAHFRKRCKEDAKETINRVIDDVDAIFLMKPRQRATERELADQFWMGDPYGYSSYEALNPAGAYLYGRSGKTISGRQLTPIQGYSYVEMPNPLHRQGSGLHPFLRYQLEHVVVINSVTKQPEKRIEPRAKKVNELLSRFGITWQDISTPEDRKYWVAGGKLTVLDLETKEIVAERAGYVIDPKFGSTRQGRRIWLSVGFVSDAFCPRFEMQSHRNTEFVAKVLRAPRGKANAR